MSKAGGLKAPNKIQPRDYSSGGDPDGFRYGPLGSETNVNGNRNVAYLWNDDNGRNLNLNWIDNDWNDNYRFLAVRKSLHVFSNTLILWMGVVLFEDIFANCRYLYRSRSEERQAPRIFSGPDNALPMRPA